MNMKQVGFFPQKGRIFVIVAHNEQELQGYTLEGKQIFAASSPLEFEMQYFITANDKVMVVCDGNGENADKYGRFRYNFYLDTDTGELTKESIAY
ncbi:MAG: hypothetical protein K2O34_05195 [Acetatifactor sp.]|nr:hypothetical protein [Acetatifactor sp.]